MFGQIEGNAELETPVFDAGTDNFALNIYDIDFAVASELDARIVSDVNAAPQEAYRAILERDPRQVDKVEALAVASAIIRSIGSSQNVGQLRQSVRSALDPRFIDQIHQIDRVTGGYAIMGATYGQYVASGLLNFAETSYPKSMLASSVWLPAYRTMKSSLKMDTGRKKFLEAGMLAAFKQETAQRFRQDSTPVTPRERTARTVLRNSDRVRTPGLQRGMVMVK